MLVIRTEHGKLHLTIGHFSEKPIARRCVWVGEVAVVTFQGFGARRWNAGTVPANVKTNNTLPFQQKAAEKVHTLNHWHQPGSVIQYFHSTKNLLWFQVRTKRMKKINTM